MNSMANMKTNCNCNKNLSNQKDIGQKVVAKIQEDVDTSFEGQIAYKKSQSVVTRTQYQLDAAKELTIFKSIDNVKSIIKHEHIPTEPKVHGNKQKTFISNRSRR